jgi:hypothetical protein
MKQVKIFALLTFELKFTLTYAETNASGAVD